MKSSKALRRMWHSIPASARKPLKAPIQSAISTLVQQAGCGFIDHTGLLKHIKSNGFFPQTIIDAGAFVGDWSRTAKTVFPDARTIMVEGNEENREHLVAATRELNDSEYALAVLGPESDAEVVFHVQSQGSSVLQELTPFAGQKKVVAMTRLDDLMAGRKMPEPILLKLDVQGFELEVLRGAPATLARSEVVILEAALLPYNQGAPLFAEVISFMADADFVVYDFCGDHRRESDSALFQADVVFARTNSQLRANKKFWLHEAPLAVASEGRFGKPDAVAARTVLQKR